ncbi:hypothetical protein QFZ31_006646 [Neobacillus niacini]|uniref:DUF7448 domain-containing protein n=1 Tax=Neobacillus driksii TaxID=3035913 RepID=UPI002781F691|nr:hypothetical protein [Neobacillus niacini]MDQ0976594.1 hypothetical protein [Neobacillus niacini]
MGWFDRYKDISVLEGQVIKEIKQVDTEELYFYMEDGRVFKMYHDQDCCESVYIEDIIGDLDDLIGTHIGLAEEVTEEGTDSEWGDSFTWTFYKIVSIKGAVTIRWYGSSNGYYSESVSFVEIDENDNY